MKANAKRAKRASAMGMDVLAGGYRMEKNGPDVNAAEVELEHVASLEVSISWGDNVLHVEHLTPPRAFELGEGADFTVEPSALGATRMPLVVIENGMPAIVLPHGASGQIETVGALPDRIADLIAAGRTAAFVDPKGIVQNARVLVLQAGSQATVRYPGSDLSFRVASVCAGRPVPVDLFTPASGDAAKFVAASFIAHASMLGAMAFFMPGLGGTDAESIDASNVLMMQKFLSASADRELEAQQAAGAASGGDGEQSEAARRGEEGSRASGEAGQAGSKTSSNAAGRVGVQKHDGEPTLSRAAEIEAARHSDMAQLVASLAPTSALSQFTQESGFDPSSAQGNMFLGDIATATGAGGLYISNTGEGGGGQGNLIALDGIHGVGLGGEPWGNCTGPNCGGGKGGGPGGPGGNGGSCTGPDCGTGHGAPGVHMRAHIPGVRPERPFTTETSGGRLDREVIQRIVRQNFGRFRACYEEGLRTNPSLTGRVEVKFVIGRDGSVTTSSDGGSDIPDTAVVKCVVRNFAPLSFPQPQGGVVAVTYPLVFSPSE